MSFAAAARHCHPAALAAVLLSGCTGVQDQSILHPAGPAAAEIARLWWLMLGAFTGVFGAVLILLLLAVFRRPSRAAVSGDHRDAQGGASAGGTALIVTGGVVLPVVVLTPLFLAALHASASLRQPQEALTIQVVGHMWWWEVRYPEQGIVTANELHIPAGRPVRLELTSADVIHSFWVPRLHGKRDMIPGIENIFWMQADEPGVYRGQCSEYCGTQHANMALEVIALPADRFGSWLAERTRPRPDPAEGEARRGSSVFLSAGCPQCHAVSGTSARGNAGPDLTHLASRRTIGAAMLPNSRASLAGWVADAQAIKPGIKMPRTYLASDDLMALVAYLESLR